METSYGEYNMSFLRSTVWKFVDPSVRNLRKYKILDGENALHFNFLLLSNFSILFVFTTSGGSVMETRFI